MSSEKTENVELDEQTRERDYGRLYVRNFDTNTSEEDFEKAFAKYNPSDILIKNGRYCFISFDSQENAKKAKEELNETEIDGRKVYIDFALKKLSLEEYKKQSTVPSRVLYAGGLDDSTDADKIQNAFSKYGDIDSVKIYKNKKGFNIAFVTFVDISSAEKANGQNLIIDGKDLNVEYVLNRRGRRANRFRGRGVFRGRGRRFSAPVSDTKVYVSGLDVSTNEESIKEHFSLYGQISDIDIVRDRNSNRPKGHAFVTYMTPAEADEALDKLKGIKINGNEINLEKARTSFRSRPFRMRARRARNGSRGRRFIRQRNNDVERSTAGSGGVITDGKGRRVEENVTAAANSGENESWAEAEPSWGQNNDESQDAVQFSTQ